MFHDMTLGVQFGKGELYIAGPRGRTWLAAELQRLNVPGFTITEAEGFWQGEREVSYVVTIIAPMAGEAHAMHDTAGNVVYSDGNKNEPVIIAGDPDAFASRLRFLAEQLALTFGQSSVWYTLTPIIHGATTRQAAYVRDTSRANQPAPLRAVSADTHAEMVP